MKNWVPAFQLLGIGFYVVVCVAGGIMGGWWWGGKRPVFVIVGLIIGLALAFYGGYRMVKPIMDNYKNNKNGKENG